MKVKHATTHELINNSSAEQHHSDHMHKTIVCRYGVTPTSIKSTICRYGVTPTCIKSTICRYDIMKKCQLELAVCL